jgi:hypothetical protein
MRVLPQTPLDWVLLAVAASAAVIIAVSLQDFFLDSRTNNPKLRALQDVGVGFAVIHFFALLLLGSKSPAWAGAAIAMYVLATLLFLGALESAQRVPAALVDDRASADLWTVRGSPSVTPRLRLRGWPPRSRRTAR